MKLERALFSVSLIVIFGLCYASYIVKDDGKNINVTNKQANLIDDIEMQEGEALSQNQIINIINANSSYSLK
ncbi:hypothetical protein CDV26_07760 [Francisella halioticida]|uniref:Uncharacterized protein n=1 Tax=Francisella halioticida TaxID=549298 RepID=A0ABM6M1X9_9GAMM|nr:hypothetical protein [Francisella halioticida]ASG69034.1 hypothetical protein CDV26_07760 [Francisella halioticida]